MEPDDRALVASGEYEPAGTSGCARTLSVLLGAAVNATPSRMICSSLLLPRVRLPRTLVTLSLNFRAALSLARDCGVSQGTKTIAEECMRSVSNGGRVFVISILSTFCALAVAGGEPLTRANTEQIDRGRYLVKTTGCNDCHTPEYVERAGDVPESQWLIGASLGWQGPWGTTYPINLRDLVQTLSAEEWLEVARRPARPPMPWFALRDMTDEDLTAIYSFIRSLGPAGRKAPPFVPPGQAAKTPVVRFPSTREHAKAPQS